MTELGGGKLDESGVCLVPEVKPGHRYRWLWRNREHYWNASHLRLILSAQSLWVTAEKLCLRPAALPLSSVCMSFSFTHTVTDVIVHSSVWVYSVSSFLMQFTIVYKTTDVWFTFLYWRTAGCFAIFSRFFRPKAIPLLESVTNSFSQL